MISTVKKVLEYIKVNSLIDHGDTVIAGVSGGADSICLISIFLELRSELGIKLVVAHVDHGIRGEEAESDAAFVRDYCAANSLEFELARADIPKMASETGMSEEEAGRSYRYAFFMDIAKKYGAEKVAVAHNSRDNAETVLFNIFRGSGIGGLKGIQPKRLLNSASEKKIFLIRPVLCLSRTEIEDYLRKKGQTYCTDSTNYEDSYSRNRIRNSILPIAEEHINSNTEGHINSLSLQAAEIEEYLTTQADPYMSSIERFLDDENRVFRCRIKYSEISGIHPCIRKIVLRKAFELVSGRLKDIGEVHIRAIEELNNLQSGKRISMPYDIVASKEYDSIIIEKNHYENNLNQDEISLEIFDRDELEIEIPHKQDEKWFDFDKVGSIPVLRKPEADDFILIGTEKHKKSLRRFMIDSKIPSCERKDVTLLAVGSHVLWVVGYRQDESCLITDKTVKVLVAKRKTEKR